MQVAGHDVATLANSYGTPLLILNEDDIRRRAQAYRQALHDSGYPRWQVVYAAKAFISFALADLLQQENIGLDVVSGGELYLVQAAGFPAENILFHGNNKSSEELHQAVKAGLGRIVVDNFDELERLTAVARAAGVKVPILLRVAPGVEADTHSYIQTGTQDTKFGFDLASGQALAAVKLVADNPHLDLRGLHSHIGSQILTVEPFLEAASRMVELMQQVKQTLGYTVDELDLGGGLGIKYTVDDEPPAIGQLVAALTQRVETEARRYNVPLPKLILEPGRSLVGEAGTTVYTVGSIKRVPGLPAFVAVDGGMSDNPRHALYDAVYTPLLMPPPGQPGGADDFAARPLETCRLVGKLCESGDVLVDRCQLPAPQPGDLVILLSTGAYTFSMASNYNHMLRPAVVMVNRRRARLIVRRQQYRDFLRGQQSLTAEAPVLERRPAP